MNTAYGGGRAAVPILGMAQPGSSSLDEKSWGALLVVWRVRFWLLALAVGLLAGYSHSDEAQRLAGQRAATVAGCSVAMAKQRAPGLASLPAAVASRGCEH